MIRKTSFVAILFLAACTTGPRPGTVPVAEVREVQILALNDFHGNLEPPGISYEGAKGKTPVGGAAYLANALKATRTGASITVAAGDLISASPLVSSLFYDEPTIDALDLAGLNLASVGNHEFDRGADELKRMQAGGCRAKQPNEQRTSCPAGTRFDGAQFQYLAANVRTADGATLFPGTALRDIGGTKVGFVGMTLKATASLVSPGGVAGLTFEDEAATANAAVEPLLAAGAKTVVLLIHEGGATTGAYDDKSCPGLSGAILAITDKLDPRIRTVVTGHTHQAYLCRLPIAGGGERLMTSSGRYGGLVADIRLTFAPDGTLSGQTANFVEVQGEPITTPGKEVPINAAVRRFDADPAVAALVARYKAAAAPIAEQPIGRLGFSVAQRDPDLISPGALFISDAMLHVARDPAKGGADVALMNTGGARADLAGGEVSYGDLFRLQPFENALVTVSLTGAELKAVLEQIFDSGTNSAARPNYILPSANMTFSVDRSRAAGPRVFDIRIDGRPLDPAREYRVVTNNFLASGGDNFTAFAVGRRAVDGGNDLAATAVYIQSGKAKPPTKRVTDKTPAGWTAPN